MKMKTVSVAPYFCKALMFSTLAITAFLFFGCASTGSNSVSGADVQKRQQALARSDLLIVPGQRVGPIRIGIGWDEVIATLGEPDFSYVNTGDPLKIETQMRYHSLNLEIVFGGSATPMVKLMRVVARSTKQTYCQASNWAEMEPVTTAFKTAEGIGLGSSSFDVARTYGPYEAVGTVFMRYPQRNLGFTVTPDHRVCAITTGN